MEEIATVYARSLFEVAQEHKKLDLVRDQFGEFADALADSGAVLVSAIRIPREVVQEVEAIRAAG